MERFQMLDIHNRKSNTKFPA